MKLAYLGALIFIRGLAVDCLAAECPAALGSQDTKTQFQTLDRRAQVEFRHGEFAKAAEDFRQATCLAPENIRSYYELYSVALAALTANDPGQARKALE